MKKEQIEHGLTPALRKQVFSDLGFRFNGHHMGVDGWVAGVLGPKELGEGKNGNFSINLITGAVKDHGSSGWSGDLYSAVEAINHIDFGEALTFVSEKAGLTHKPKWNPFNDGRQVAVYPYTNEQEEVLYEVVRFEVKEGHEAYPDKTFIQRVPGKGWGREKYGVAPVLYHLPAVIEAARAGHVVFVVEGEKDVETLEEAGFTATTCLGGAGKWKAEYAEVLAGAYVVVLPDNDAVGRRHAETVARTYYGKAKSVRIVELPNLNPKGDVTDWMNAGGNVEDLKALTQSTAPYKLVQETPPLKEEESEGAEVDTFETARVFTRKRKVQRLGELHEEVTNRFEHMRAGTLNEYEPTGFLALDRVIEGGAKGHMNTIAGLSGSGKTSWLLQCASNAVWRFAADERAVFFSAEMLKYEVYERMACQQAHISHQRLRRRHATDEEWKVLQQAVDEIKEWPLFIDDTPRPGLSHMDEVLHEQAKQGVIKWIGFDYIEKCGTHGQTEELRISTAAQGISEIAKGYEDAPFWILSQLNRGILSRSNTRPSSKDLRYSQKIFDESYIVLMIDSPAALDKHGMDVLGGDTDRVEIVVMKHRNGTDGVNVPMRFIGKTTSFEDYEEVSRRDNIMEAELSQPVEAPF